MVAIINYLVANVLADQAALIVNHPSLPVGILPAQERRYANEKRHQPNDNNHCYYTARFPLAGVVHVGNCPIPVCVYVNHILIIKLHIKQILIPPSIYTPASKI